MGNRKKGSDPLNSDSFDADDISGGLEKIYSKFSAKSDEYVFNHVVEIKSHDLQAKLEKQFLKNYLNQSVDADSDGIKNTRFNVVFYIIELIRIALDDESDSNFSRKIYSSDILWEKEESSYSGKVFIFQVGDSAIYMKLIKKQ